MIKSILNNKVDAGKNAVEEGTPSNDCLTWFSPGGHLDGPQKESTRCPRVVRTKAADKVIKTVDWSIDNRRANKGNITDALRKVLRTRCNRRRNNARNLAYHYLGVYMEPLFPEATVQPVIITAASGEPLGSDAAVLEAQGIPGFQLVLVDGGPVTMTLLDAEAIATGLLSSWHSTRGM